MVGGRGKPETFMVTWVLLKQGKYNQCQMKNSLFHVDLTDGQSKTERLTLLCNLMFKAHTKEWLRRIEHGGWVRVIYIEGTCLGFLHSKLKSL